MDGQKGFAVKDNGLLVVSMDWVRFFSGFGLGFRVSTD